MKCDCIKKIEGRLKEVDYHEASCRNISFTINENKMETGLTIPFSYRKKKKNGDFAQGKKTIDVESNYCPFCGTDQKIKYVHLRAPVWDALKKSFKGEIYEI